MRPSALDRPHATPHSRDAFTLLEFLVVIVIIGVLTSYVVTRTHGVRERAYVDALKSDLRRLATLQEGYLANGTAYASDPLSIPGFALSADVAIDASAGDGTSWSTTLSHAKTDATCDLTVGTGTANAGRITCSTDPGGGPPANAVPTAVVAFAPATPAPAAVVTFDGTGSSDADGSIASYSWSSSDGASGTGETWAHPFATAGTYTVTLTVTDDQGATDAVAQSVTVVAASGAAYAWGPNTNGQLGDGTTTTRATPTAVAGSHLFTSVSAGKDHSCALTASGTAYCWGANNYGQLGTGATGPNQLTPIVAASGLTFQQIAAGGLHTCGLTTDGNTYCWGYGLQGQLGQGAAASSATPVLVNGGHSFASLDAYENSTCGITTSGGGWCWGYNGTYQLGDGTLSSRASPVAVGGGHTWRQIAIGAAHACGVTTAGVAYCWGYGLNGRLGVGSTSNMLAPAVVSGGHTFTNIDAGHTYSCARTSAGIIWCWGSDATGQLGLAATASDQLTPVAVDGGLTFTQLSLGIYTACGLIPSGAAYCWGQNAAGSPGALAGGRVFRGIARGSGYAGLAVE